MLGRPLCPGYNRLFQRLPNLRLGCRGNSRHLLVLRFDNAKAKFSNSFSNRVVLCLCYLGLGLDNFTKDIEFMLGQKLSVYWKVSWAYIIPATLLTIFCYSLSIYTTEDIGELSYPKFVLGKLQKNFPLSCGIKL